MLQLEMVLFVVAVGGAGVGGEVDVAAVGGHGAENEPCTEALVTVLLVAPLMKRMVDVPVVGLAVVLAMTRELPLALTAVDGDVVGAVQVDEGAPRGGGAGYGPAPHGLQGDGGVGSGA
jgi:hypothetical protein